MQGCCRGLFSGLCYVQLGRKGRSRHLQAVNDGSRWHMFSRVSSFRPTETSLTQSAHDFCVDSISQQATAKEGLECRALLKLSPVAPP